MNEWWERSKRRERVETWWACCSSSLLKFQICRRWSEVFLSRGGSMWSVKLPLPLQCGCCVDGRAERNTGDITACELMDGQPGTCSRSHCASFTATSLGYMYRLTAHKLRDEPWNLSHFFTSFLLLLKTLRRLCFWLDRFALCITLTKSRHSINPSFRTGCTPMSN